MVAGHSLGEYSGAGAAGAFTVADAASLLKLRGQAMQKAVPAGQGAMAALLGAEMGKRAGFARPRRSRQRAAESPARKVIQPANDNGAGQVVMSGHRAAVERAVEIAPARASAAPCCCRCPPRSIAR